MFRGFVEKYINIKEKVNSCFNLLKRFLFLLLFVSDAQREIIIINQIDGMESME